jgi:hypothetical protein
MQLDNIVMKSEALNVDGVFQRALVRNIGCSDPEPFFRLMSDSCASVAATFKTARSENISNQIAVLHEGHAKPSCSLCQQLSKIVLLRRSLLNVLAPPGAFLFASPPSRDAGRTAVGRAGSFNSGKNGQNR